MDKWSSLFSAPPSRLTVVGMAKNAGKTLTQNYLRTLVQTDGYAIGLLSIGLDGEKIDALTRLPKPAVWVKPGTFVATATNLIERPFSWDCLRETEISTPVGMIHILRARNEEQIVLAGPSKNSEVVRILKEMIGYGAQCVFIDGAFDRQSSADPLISDQVVLASGASLISDLAALVSITRCRVEQLTLPECSADHAEMARQCRGSVSRCIAGRLEMLSYSTALLDCLEWVRVLKDSDVLLVKGAVGEDLGKALLQTDRRPTVILQDSSKLFLSPEMWQRLRQRKVQFAVERPINLLGVTVNPTCPGSAGLDADQLLASMGRALYPLPVMDVARKLKYVQQKQDGREVSG
ncbi:MAG: hypothetical protein AB9917_24455 [Negativicutes bacterium]